MGDRPSLNGQSASVLTGHRLISALHPSGVAKSSTSFCWGKGGNVTSAGWQVTLCDPIWHVSSRSGDAFANCYRPLYLSPVTQCGCMCAHLLQVRQFAARQSAGLRVRLHPSLQSEQIGIIPPHAVITFTSEVHCTHLSLSVCLSHSAPGSGL